MTTIDIILFCYKQEQYIEQALRSIYAQELPKDVSARIIVGDDASPDNTLAIIKRFAPESPFPMVFLPEEPNLGISKNYKRSFAATTADYVAILEGDDYWLPTHLAQHVEFMQAHPECSLSMNEITFLHEPSGIIDVGRIRLVDKQECVLVDVHKQIADGNQLGNLSACMIRGKYLRELPSNLFDMPIADWMLGVMISQRGDMAILKGTTSVYRVKASGVWAGKNRWQKYFKMLRYANMYDKFQQRKYHAEWELFKQKCGYEVRYNWMHDMPEGIQRFWRNVKRVGMRD